MAVSRRASWILVSAFAVAAVFVTRWPFRSEFLFSWDSANFALAMERIDIAAHRPHPPGYLGYVIAARGLEPFTADANRALVLWNIIATALAVVVLVRFADECDTGRPVMLIAAAAIAVTSPLLWFYSDIAEIYPSELLVTLLVGFFAWRVIRGEAGSIYSCVAALALAAVFKLTAALFMTPLALYAWVRVPRRQRARSAAVFATLLVAVAALFLTLQPDLPTIIREQFLSSTAGSRVVIESERPSVIRAINRGFRSTLLALAIAVGPLNVLALLWWTVRDRRLVAFGYRFALLWTVPFLLVFIFIHLGKPGYVLPLLPIPVLVLASMYSRLRPATAALIITAQALVNVGWFVAMKPFPDAWTGGPARYNSKSVVQRAASDLQPLTYPSAFTIAESDTNVRKLLSYVHAHCPRPDAIIIAGTEPVDWRRVTWYFPSATAIHVAGGRMQFIARDGAFESLGDEGLTLRTTCPPLWLAKDASSTELPLPSHAVPVAGLGFSLPSGVVQLAPTGMIVR